MVYGLVDAAGAVLDIADVASEVADVGRKRKRWKGCLNLLVTVLLVAMLFWLLAD